MRNKDQRNKRKLPPEKKSPSKGKKLLLFLVFFLVFFLLVFFRPVKAPYLKERTEKSETAQSSKKEDFEDSSSFEDGLLADPMPRADLEEVNKVRIFAVGDIMHHLEQAQRVDRGVGPAKDEFALIKDFLNQADFVIGNFESTSSGDRPLSGYPMFNTPEHIFPALKDAGFDALTTVNNHSLDSGISGLESTLKRIRLNDMLTVGTRLSGEERTTMVKVNGIKIGLGAYSFAFNGLENAQSPETMDRHLNELNPAEIKGDIEKLKEEGADFILIYPHWGQEYTHEPTLEQQELADKMIQWGADAVIGNHPHVVQPCEFIESSDGRKGFVIYACGNFISMQRYGSFPDYSEEQSVLVEMNLEKIGKSHAQIKEIAIHPLWVRESRDQEGLLYQPLLVEEYRTGAPKAESLNEEENRRVDRAYQDIKRVIYQMGDQPVKYGNE